MLILYITYIDFGTAASGSGVRPQRMYRAFLDEGHQVKLLSGQQGAFRSAEMKARKKAVEEISGWLDRNRPDLCYIESPVRPIMWSFDRQLIRKIHRLGIPIGYFYRDFFRRFPELYPRDKGLVGSIKETGLDLLQRRTDELLRLADVVYFPSEAAARLFDYRDMRPLPPAGEAGESSGLGEKNTCIYVGGMGGQYGGEELLDAFSILNDGGERYPLILVCREREWAAVSEEHKRADWLEIHHTTGAGLAPLYERAALAVLPVRKTAYTDLAVNVKLFEYMSYGLPVASTNVTAVSALVEENGVGSVSGDSPAEMAENIRSMLASPEKMERWRKNSRTMLVGHNLWTHRARRVVRDLTEGKA